MRRIAFTMSVVGAVAIALFSSARASADVVLWYNGDLPANGGATVNEQTTNLGALNTYDNFNVTSPGGWMIDRVWSNNQISITGITQAEWEIRSGMSVGNGGVVVASGTGAATQTPTGRTGFSGSLEYTVAVTGLNVSLAPGTYWLTVSPLVGNDPISGGLFLSYNSATDGTNAVGTPPGNDGGGLFNSAFLGYSYVNFDNEYSMGVAGASSAVPEPSAFALLGLAAAALAGCAWHGRQKGITRQMPELEPGS